MDRNRLISIIFAIFALAHLSLQASTKHDDTYLAGVVEFRPSNSGLAVDRMQNNLEGYLTILNSGAAKNLDIIVFPESTLNNVEQALFVPNPAKGLIVPCDKKNSDYHSSLVQLSCAAKNLSVYMVINLSEKERCEEGTTDSRPCARSGLNIYNTNVVFDRHGAVISRYRKIHLYNENINVTAVPEIVLFDTDFGVRFGQFICFDILFYTPAQFMVDHIGVKDFIFSTMWFSQLPFLTAMQIQQGWAYANNVNLLAAGASHPLVGSTGSGVYHGRQGAVAAKMNLVAGERKLYVAEVTKYKIVNKRALSEPPSRPNSSIGPTIKLGRDFLQSYKTLLLDLKNSNSLQQELCFFNSSLCCHFDLKWRMLELKNNVKHYYYRVGVYDGLRSEEAAESNQLKNCALFSCTGQDIMDCGKVFSNDIDVVFENITITATFPKAERFLLMPNSLNSSIMPLPANHFQWQEIDKRNSVQVRFELNTTTSNIMAFAIYGNYYDCIVKGVSGVDGTKNDGAAAVAVSVAVTVTVISLINLIL